MSSPASLIAKSNEYVVASLLEVCRAAKTGSLILFSFTALVFISGCSMSEQKQQAQVVLESYYDAIESQFLDRALDLYSPDFLTKHSRQDWENVLTNVNANR